MKASPQVIEMLLRQRRQLQLRRLRLRGTEAVTRGRRLKKEPLVQRMEAGSVTSDRLRQNFGVWRRKCLIFDDQDFGRHASKSILTRPPPTSLVADWMKRTVMVVRNAFEEFFQYPLSPKHSYYMSVCLTGGTARIFIEIPLFYLSHNKSFVSRVTPSHLFSN